MKLIAKRNGNGHKRRLNDLRRLRKLYAETMHSFGRGAWYDESKGRIVKYSFSHGGRGNKSTYAKRESNRKVRHGDKTVCYRGGQYRKLFDYWCETSW